VPERENKHRRLKLNQVILDLFSQEVLDRAKQDKDRDKITAHEQEIYKHVN